MSWDEELIVGGGMGKKYMWLIIAALILFILAQNCYLYKQNKVSEEIVEVQPLKETINQKSYPEKNFIAQWEEFEKWRDKVRKQIGRGAPLMNPDFDDFFDDSFFSRKFNPFAEMERIRRQMSQMFGESERILFDYSWGNWFEQRMGLGQFETKVIKTDKDVILSIHVPGLAAKTFNINMTDERIKISFSAKTLSEEEKKGVTVKKASFQNYIKILPIPYEAVTGTGKVEIEGEYVKIKFDRKKEGQ